MNQQQDKNNKAMKPNVAHRYLKAKLRTPYVLAAENKVNYESLRAILREKAEEFLNGYSKTCRLQFYTRYRPFLPSAEKKIEEYSAHGFTSPVTELIPELSDPVSRLIALMEERQSPIECIEDSDFLLACYLMEARILTELLRKHYKEIADGAEALEKADEIFENLCSKMRIPRRTRALIKSKAGSSGRQRAKESEVGHE